MLNTASLRSRVNLLVCGRLPMRHPSASAPTAACRAARAYCRAAAQTNLSIVIVIMIDAAVFMPFIQAVLTIEAGNGTARRRRLAAHKKKSRRFCGCVMGVNLPNLVDAYAQDFADRNIHAGVYVGIHNTRWGRLPACWLSRALGVAAPEEGARLSKCATGKWCPRTHLQ